MNAPTSFAAAIEPAQAAINRDIAANANRAADRFTLTEAQYQNLAALPEIECAYQLRQLINQFDADRRPIIGVYGSLTMAGQYRWQTEWLASEDGHMMRAWRAFEEAARKYVGEAA